jgi:hypothetical protein
VRGLWRCQVLPERSALTPAHLELLFQLTGGFPKFLCHLLAYSQQRAVAAGAKQLTLEIIEQAARASSMLNEMRSMIDAFVSRDVLRLKAFNDVDLDYYRKRWASSLGEPPASELAPSASPRRKKTQQEVLRQDQTKAKASRTRAQNKRVVDAEASDNLTSHLLQELDDFVK